MVKVSWLPTREEVVAQGGTLALLVSPASRCGRETQKGGWGGGGRQQGQREVLNAHRSCKVHRCAQEDTHRLQSLGGTSLQDHIGTSGSSWHQIPLEGSLYRQPRRPAEIRVSFWLLFGTGLRQGPGCDHLLASVPSKQWGPVQPGGQAQLPSWG